MDPRIAALVTRAIDLLRYADGKPHWRRIIALGVVPLFVWALDAFKPELLAAHWYGAAKNIGGVLGLITMAMVGRGVATPSESPAAAPLTREKLAALVAAASEAAAATHGHELPAAERARIQAGADLAAQYLAEAIKPHVVSAREG